MTTMQDVMKLNRSIGHHFFDEDTMRFFNSRIETDLLNDKFFVTSEQGPHVARAFTVRRVNDDGTIGSIGAGFMGYVTRDEAIQAIQWVGGNNDE